MWAQRLDNRAGRGPFANPDGFPAAMEVAGAGDEQPALCGSAPPAISDRLGVTWMVGLDPYQASSDQAVEQLLAHPATTWVGKNRGTAGGHDKRYPMFRGQCPLWHVAWSAFANPLFKCRLNVRHCPSFDKRSRNMRPTKWRAVRDSAYPIDADVDTGCVQLRDHRSGSPGPLAGQPSHLLGQRVIVGVDPVTEYVDAVSAHLSGQLDPRDKFDSVAAARRSHLLPSTSAVVIS
jgi:hypothetical protein